MIIMSSKDYPAWNKGMKMSDEFRRKCSIAHMGYVPWNKGKLMSDEYRKDCSLNNSGRVHSEETKRKMSIAHKRFSKTEEGQKIQKRLIAIRWSDPNQKRQARIRMIKRYSNPFEIEKQSERMREYFQNHPEALAKCSKIMNERYKDLQEREKQSKRMKDVMSDREIRKRVGDASKKHWNNKEYQEKMKKALKMKPNKMEIFVLSVLNRNFPREWKYVGDFSFWIEGKNPDFINCNGQKKIIEVFGNRWHNKDFVSFNRTERGTKNHYKKYGFDILIIWSDNLRSIYGKQETERKIIDFHNKRRGT